MARTRQKQGKTGNLEVVEQGKLLDYLDEMINAYYQKNNVWPGKIIFSKETKDKIFAELELEPDLSNCWHDKKDNYRNIPIEIKKDVFIELERE